VFFEEAPVFFLKRDLGMMLRLTFDVPEQSSIRLEFLAKSAEFTAVQLRALRPSHYALHAVKRRRSSAHLHPASWDVGRART
jgi:hypothetical protein